MFSIYRCEIRDYISLSACAHPEIPQIPSTLTPLLRAGSLQARALEGGGLWWVEVVLVMSMERLHKAITKLRGVIPARVRNGARKNKKPPVISRIKVGLIEKAPFVSTTIMCYTDEPSSTCVEYGGLPEEAATERPGETLEKIKIANANLREAINKFRL